ncbi:MAG: hypothetical protein AAF327_10190 [Cyanobacteria bacterium P01_A01_bin.37]
MFIRNSIVTTGAVAAGATPVLLVTGLMSLSPWFGAAAFTSSLSTLGGSLIAGLLGLIVLSTILAIATYIYLQIQLSWLLI